MKLKKILKNGKEVGIRVQYKEINYSDETEWHKIRKNHIGGSDCSIIMGYNEYKNIVDLWREKTGRKTPDDLSENQAIIRGKKSENLLIEHFAINNPDYSVSKLEKTLESLKYPFMAANLDGVLEHKEFGKGVLEIKTATCFNSNQYYDIWLVKDDNGRYTVDDIPINYWLQIQHYLAVTGWEYAVLYADVKLSFQNDRHILKKYICHRNEEAIKEIIEKELEFNSYVINDVEPAYKKKMSI